PGAGSIRSSRAGRSTTSGPSPTRPAATARSRRPVCWRTAGDAGTSRAAFSRDATPRRAVVAFPAAAHGPVLQLLHDLPDPRALGDPRVQADGAGVGLVGQPVELVAGHLTGLPLHVFDQLAA